MSPRFATQCNALPTHATMFVHGHSEGRSLVQLLNTFSVGFTTKQERDNIVSDIEEMIKWQFRSVMNNQILNVRERDGEREKEKEKEKEKETEDMRERKERWFR